MHKNGRFQTDQFLSLYLGFVALPSRRGTILQRAAKAGREEFTAVFKTGDLRQSATFLEETTQQRPQIRDVSAPPNMACTIAPIPKAKQSSKRAVHFYVSWWQDDIECDQSCE